MPDYNDSIPQPAELISVSQGEILTNFTQLNAQFGGKTPTTGGDHDGFNNGSGNGSGMHNQVTFHANQAAPSLTRNGIGGVSGLYVNTVGGLSQLFFQNASQNLQLTGVLSATKNPGYITLPGGFIIQWNELGISGSTATFTYPFAYSTFFSILGIAGTQPTTFYVSAASLSALTVTRTGSGSSSCWVSVIGI